MQIQPLRTVDIVQHGCYVNRTSCVLQAINKYNANVLLCLTCILLIFNVY